MAMNIATQLTKSFCTVTGAVGFVPYRSAPAVR